MKQFEANYTLFQEAVENPEAWEWLNTLDDEGLMLLWEKFGDIAIFDSDAVTNMIEEGEYDLSIVGMKDDAIDEPFVVWPRGTERMEIWHWFDERLSMGLGEFLEQEVS